MAEKYMHKGKSVTGDDLGLAEALVPTNPAAEEAQVVYHPNRVISDEEKDQMMREYAATGSMKAVTVKWDVHESYLKAAMKRKYGSLEAMKQALLGLVTENAITSQIIASQKMGDLSAGQAVFAGKLLVDTMTNIEKSIASAPKTIDFAQMKRVGDSIKTLRDIVGRPVPT